jgi:hypothetical protein
MPGLVPGIHVLISSQKDVDGRDKPGHADAATPRSQARDRHMRKPSIAVAEGQSRRASK